MKYVCCSHTSALGGAELAFVEMVRCLSSEGQVVVTMPNSGFLSTHLQQLGIADIAVHNWTLWMQQDFTIKRRLKCLLKLCRDFVDCLSFFCQENPNVVIVNTIASPLPLLAAKILRIPSVVFVHEKGGFGVYHFLFGEALSKKIVGWIGTHVVCNSQYTYSDYMQYIPIKKMSVIYQPIDISPIAKIPHEDFTIGCVGVLSSQKNYRFLLHAISKLPANIHCRIAGFCSNEYGERMKLYCEELGITDRVEWCGVVQDMPAFYASIDVLVACGKQEALGRSVVEAMKCQTLVIAANEGGYCELVSDGKTGYVYRADDEEDFVRAVMLVLRSPMESIQRVQTTAKDFVQDTFSKEKFSSAFLQLIRDIAK